MYNHATIKTAWVFLNNVFFCYGHGGHAVGFLFSVSIFKLEHPEMCQTFSCEHSRTIRVSGGQFSVKISPSTRA